MNKLTKYGPPPSENRPVRQPRLTHGALRRGSESHGPPPRFESRATSRSGQPPRSGSIGDNNPETSRETWLKDHPLPPHLHPLGRRFGSSPSRHGNQIVVAKGYRSTLATALPNRRLPTGAGLSQKRSTSGPEPHRSPRPGHRGRILDIHPTLNFGRRPPKRVLRSQILETRISAC
jgi:hypothetical protein